MHNQKTKYSNFHNSFSGYINKFSQWSITKSFGKDLLEVSIKETGQIFEKSSNYSFFFFHPIMQMEGRKYSGYIRPWDRLEDRYHAKGVLIPNDGRHSIPAMNLIPSSIPNFFK